MQEHLQQQLAVLYVQLAIFGIMHIIHVKKVVILLTTKSQQVGLIVPLRAPAAQMQSMEHVVVRVTALQIPHRSQRRKMFIIAPIETLGVRLQLTQRAQIFLTVLIGAVSHQIAPCKILQETILLNGQNLALIQRFSHLLLIAAQKTTKTARGRPAPKETAVQI